MLNRSVLLTSTILAALSVQPCSAGLMTYYGVDLNPGGTVPPGGDAAAARQDFLDALSGGVGTEDFEGFSDKALTPLTLTFPGSSGRITATLSGSGNIEDDPGDGRFATSGDTFFETGSGGDFNITFDTEIAAFGFFGIDIGDINNNLVLTLTDGTTKQILLGTSGNNDGSLLFFGFTDNMNTYTNIAFSNQPTGNDIFGFDDMTVGDIGQVQSAVPEPTSWVLLLTGFVALAAFGSRRQRLSPKNNLVHQEKSPIAV